MSRRRHSEKATKMGQDDYLIRAAYEHRDYLYRHFASPMSADRAARRALAHSLAVEQRILNHRWVQCLRRMHALCRLDRGVILAGFRWVTKSATVRSQQWLLVRRARHRLRRMEKCRRLMGVSAVIDLKNSGGHRNPPR